MGLLTPELANKRLQAANASQEGIENISTWMLHHSDSVRMLADCWLDLFRTESEERRVVLFYVMNDVVQRAKKKHVDVFCSAFEQPAMAAVSMARNSEKLRNVMTKCLKLIAECKAFSASGVEKMKRLMSDPNGENDDGNYEIDVMDLAKKIEAFMSSVNTISKGYEVLKRSPVDLEDQIQTRMKDRKEGALLLKETRTAILRLEKFGEAVAVNNKRLYEFVDAIETAKRSFNMQLRDVAVVEDAYVKFGQGVREVQDEVEEMVRTGVYPAGSPPRDAPSPSAEDDVFSGGVEQHLYKTRPHDVTDEADMDVDDDEPPLPPQKWEKKPTQPSAPPAMARPSIMEKAAALAANMPFLASHMGIDPRARPNTVAAKPVVAAAAPVAVTPTIPTVSSTSSSSIAAPPAKKPSIDSDLHAIFMRAAATIPSLAHHAPPSTFTLPPSTVPPAVSTVPLPTSYSQPPPNFAPNIPPPPPSVVAQWAMQQQQQAAATPLAVQTHPPSLPTIPPPISPYSAPPPGYPPVSAAAQQQYMVMQQQQQLQQQQQQQQNRAQQAHFSAPPPTRSFTSYGGTAAAGGYQQTAAAGQQQYAAATQGYGMEQGQAQQGQKKYSTMPEFTRSHSTPGGGGPLVSPTAAAPSTGYYPVHNTPSTPSASTSATPNAAGTPYTPTAPGYRGRKGSEGGAGGYGRGGGQQYNSGYGGGYGNRQEEQSEDAYQPQRKESHDDSDFRQQQYQPRGGGGTARGYGRGNQGGGYGRYQRGGGRGGYGSQQNYGNGGYSNNQGY